MSEKQYVAFKLNHVDYGVDIKSVKEIIENKQSTKIPNAPIYVDGVINVRGDTIPVINLKKIFNFKENEKDCMDKRIIIVEIESKNVGFLIDKASQVIKLAEENIEAPPEILLSINKRYISGIGKINDKIIVLLNLEEVLSIKEKIEIQHI